MGNYVFEMHFGVKVGNKLIFCGFWPAESESVCYQDEFYTEMA